MNGMLVCAEMMHVDCLYIVKGNEWFTFQYLIEVLLQLVLWILISKYSKSYIRIPNIKKNKENINHSFPFYLAEEHVC